MTKLSNVHKITSTTGLSFCPSSVLWQQLRRLLCACCHASKTNKNPLPVAKPIPCPFLNTADPSSKQRSIAAAAVAACLATGFSSAVADSAYGAAGSGTGRVVKESGLPLQQSAAGSSTAGAGLKAYVDPETGTPEPPPAGAAAPSADPALSRSSEGLEIVDSPLGKGKMVDLKGRFRSPAAAANNADALATDQGGRPVAAEPNTSDQ